MQDSINRYYYDIVAESGEALELGMFVIVTGSEDPFIQARINEAVLLIIDREKGPMATFYPRVQDAMDAGAEYRNLNARTIH